MQKLIAAAAMSALALASHSGSAYMNENTFAEQSKLKSLLNQIKQPSTTTTMGTMTHRL